MMTPKDMTEAQWLEIACRRLCEIRKLDPDAVIGYPGALDTWQYAPRWMTLQNEVREHAEVQRAMAHASLCRLGNPDAIESIHYQATMKEKQ